MSDLDQLGLPGITRTYACRITFSENNSGGGWWLNPEQYEKLFAAGWKSGRTSYDGSVRGASRVLVLDATDQDTANRMAYVAAVEEWSSITGEDPDEIGCTCCGPPYQFYDWDTPVHLLQERSSYEQEELHAFFEEDD